MHKELSRRAFPRCCPSHTVRVTRQDKQEQRSGLCRGSATKQTLLGTDPPRQAQAAGDKARPEGQPPRRPGSSLSPAASAAPGAGAVGTDGPEAVPASLQKEPEDLEERGAAAIAPGFLVPSLPLPTIYGKFTSGRLG